jgi:hypothetical protein
MNKIKFLVLFFLFALQVSASDSLWKTIRVDENLTILFPAKLERMDTLMVKGENKFRLFILKGVTDNTTFGVTMSAGETHINVDNKESLETALKGLADGACDNAKKSGLTCKISDSTLSGVPCKIIKMDNRTELTTLVNYYFLVNDKLYVFTITPSEFATDNLAYQSDWKRLLENIRFNTKNLKEKKFGSNAESAGYKAGYLIGRLLPLALIIGLGIYFLTRSKKKTSENK